MVVKVIKYTDFNGNECEDKVYFNLTKAECAKMELAYQGGMSNYIKEVIESGDNAKIVDLFTNLILESYGVKSEDGKRFIKSAKLKEEFEQTAAFSELFVELAMNEAAAEAFVKSVIQA